MLSIFLFFFFPFFSRGWINRVSAAKASARLRCDLNIDPERRDPCQTVIAAANWRSGRGERKAAGSVASSDGPGQEESLSEYIGQDCEQRASRRNF